METTLRIASGTALALEGVADATVDLVVTSPPYPMVQMWDEIFADQDEGIAACLAAGQGPDAFDRMHALLDRAWAAAYRALKPGGILCINIGDATRRLEGDFRLYANHARILSACLDLGLAALPDILWRKPTNAPTKFMGSGMLPVGAYVTYEHEYILVLRKGPRRRFETPRQQTLRRRSAFFWHERNVWFSDLWDDIKGTGQTLGAAGTTADDTATRRTAAFPFEVAYRLVSMFSVQGDTVLDPFAGTGTTLAAALAAGRSGIGVERDAALLPVIRGQLAAQQPLARAYTQARLRRHLRFAADRGHEQFKYTNLHYGFPVLTAQERELLLPDIADVRPDGPEAFRVTYSGRPQAEFVGPWSAAELAREGSDR